MSVKLIIDGVTLEPTGSNLFESKDKSISLQIWDDEYCLTAFGKEITYCTFDDVSIDRLINAEIKEAENALADAKSLCYKLEEMREKE